VLGLGIALQSGNTFWKFIYAGELFLQAKVMY
jgi:hypothetical protein